LQHKEKDDGDYMYGMEKTAGTKNYVYNSQKATKRKEGNK
jgi:hypothetical protein